MLLKTKDVAEEFVDDTEDWMFGGGGREVAGKVEGGDALLGKREGRGINTAPGRLEGNE